MDKTGKSIKEIVLQFINETDRHLFVTGKAGTGKTTLLREISDNTSKKIAIAAPTGIAALNADGVTLHSLLKLPTEIVLPTDQRGLNRKTIGDVVAELSFSPAKEKLIQELDILIIDEVSMLRADLLDVINRILIEVRSNPTPFGGVQIVYFGDLFQLPPVANRAEEMALSKYYSSLFFFDANAIKQSPPVYIELQTIYRQNDPEFISLLNHIRENVADEKDLTALSKRMMSKIQPSSSEPVITLTSHVKRAEDINNAELDKIAGDAVVFVASLDGQVEERRMPFESELRLKVGAQVMFVKNDSSPQRNYYNGKIGTVVELSSNHVKVSIGGEQVINVEPEKWQNTEYKPNEDKGKFERTITGEVKQLPLKLAWAVTIHKSQGLTFDRAIIDAGRSFEAGQVYVALSRVRSLDGVFLMTPINADNLHPQPAVADYTKQARQTSDPEGILEIEKADTIFRLLRDKFRFINILQATAKTPPIIEKYRYSNNAKFLELFSSLQKEVNSLAGIGSKFAAELDSIWADRSTALEKGQQRIKKATEFFNSEIGNKLRPKYTNEMASLLAQRAPKDLMKFYGRFEIMLIEASRQIQQIETSWRDLISGTPVDEIRSRFKVTDETKSIASIETKKNSASLSGVQKAILKLYNENQSIAEIAAKRNVSSVAIEGHIVELVSFGLIAADTILLTERIKEIVDALQNNNLDIHATKHKLGDGASFFEIRIVLAHLKARSNSASINNQSLFD